MRYFFVFIVLWSCNNPAKEKTMSQSDSLPAVKGSVKTAQGQLEEKVSWLIGDWHLVSAKGRQTEVWKKQDDTVYTGVGFFITGKDTTSFETLKIAEQADGIVYQALVKGQNAGEWVSFNMAEAAANELKFVNPGHDYPQEILYTHVSNQYMVIRISGLVNGKMKSKEYPMMRKRL
jgi:hypothetical protein